MARFLFRQAFEEFCLDRNGETVGIFGRESTRAKNLSSGVCLFRNDGLVHPSVPAENLEIRKTDPITGLLAPIHGKVSGKRQSLCENAEAQSGYPFQTRIRNHTCPD